MSFPSDSVHERHKLDEARYFIQRMRAEHDNRTHFRFELSAFLGASRSVLQYARLEAGSKTRGMAWYDNAVAREPIFAFFKDLRDDNIHVEPAQATATITTVVSDYLIPDEDTIIPLRHNTSSCRYAFAGWQGDESVIELAERYLDALRDLVANGIAERMISG